MIYLDFILHSIESLNYNITINKLTEQFSQVSELINCSEKLKYLHPLSLVATSISNLINCVQYYEKENQFIENRMPSFLTLSEKYTLRIDSQRENIINDIYTLLTKNETSRSDRLYNEYFSNLKCETIIKVIKLLDETLCKKWGIFVDIMLRISCVSFQTSVFMLPLFRDG